MVAGEKRAPRTGRDNCSDPSPEAAQSVAGRRACVLRRPGQWSVARTAQGHIPFSFPPATRARSGCWRMVRSKSELAPELFNMARRGEWATWWRDSSIKKGHKENTKGTWMKVFESADEIEMMRTLGPRPLAQGLEVYLGNQARLQQTRNGEGPVSGPTVASCSVGRRSRVCRRSGP